jgi:nucleotide-binding universal stress UspA family protein
MITIERILCPIDMSMNSNQALRYAIALARTYEARLIACHCMDPVKFADESARAQIYRQLEGLVYEFDPQVAPPFLDWQGWVIQGDPTVDIAKEAAMLHIDLIVMQSRRRPVAAAIFGSTAEAICRETHCPVIVTHTDEREWAGLSTGEIHLRRVLAAYDFSPGSEAALSYALSLAQEYQAELHLIHILPKDAPALKAAPGGDESVLQLIMPSLAETIPEEANLWCEVKMVVKTGQPANEVLTYAEKEQIDLICLGKHGAGAGFTLLFGSNTDQVLRDARCPVLVAPPLRSL